VNETIRRTLVTFWIETKLFGLDVLDVQEVTPVLEVTPVPGAERPIAGVVTWRGVSLPVLDLRPGEAIDHSCVFRGRIVLLRRPERFGVLIDQADGIRRIDPSDAGRDGITCLDARSLLAAGFGRTT
jgi:chemotaxis signal transduction protein